MQPLLVNKALSKIEAYAALFPQMKALLEGESNRTANLANFCAVLKETFNWWWVGFYLVENQELVLGPFQGPVACTRIAFGKGVCGTAALTGEIQIVPDVEKFPGHIACSSASRSEIVIPIFDHQNKCLGVLDVDSEILNHFDETDAEQLTKLLTLIPFGINPS